MTLAPTGLIGRPLRPVRRLAPYGAFALVALGCGACAGSGAAATATVTVTVTTTVTVTPSPVAGGVDGSGAQSPADSTGPTTAPGAAAATLPDPCTLLTQEEASTLLGLKVGKGDPAGPNGTATSCTWLAPPTGPVGQVQVFVGDGVQKQLDIDKGLGHTFTPVPGVGDEATQEDGNAFVRKGTTWVSISLVRLEDEAAAKKTAQRLTAALRTAASRI